MGLTAAAPASSLARQPAAGDWVGKRVVQKYANFQLKSEDQIVDPKRRMDTYIVEQANGSRLLLHAGELRGWVEIDQVVPVEQAMEFFTNYIRSKPTDTHGFSMRAKIWNEEKQELDLALSDINEAVRLDPAKAYIYINRAVIWNAKNEHDKAIADCDVAIDAIQRSSRLLQPRPRLVF